jgi:hypothetical protein
MVEPRNCVEGLDNSQCASSVAWRTLLPGGIVTERRIEREYASEVGSC